jgi:cell volume regulation protein A
LFFAIPLEFQNDDFAPSILLYTIILTSLVMTFALIKDGKKIVTESVDIPQDDI